MQNVTGICEVCCYDSQEMDIEDAVKKAVDECIEKDILKEFLLRNKARVIKMSIYEYDEKKQREFDIEEGVEIGVDIGVIKNKIILIQKKIAKGKSLDEIATDLETSVEEIRSLNEFAISFPTDVDPTEIAKSYLRKDSKLFGGSI